MSLEIVFPRSWVCDGRELKPKSGALSSNTWISDVKRSNLKVIHLLQTHGSGMAKNSNQKAALLQKILG